MLWFSSFYVEYLEKEKCRIEKKRRYRLRLREKKNQIIEEAKSVPCTDCNEEFLAINLEFDHLRDKLFDIGSCRTKSGISVSKLLAEIAKCEVVCNSCHTTRERARGRPR